MRNDKSSPGAAPAAHSRLAWAKFLLCNLLGIFVFFITIPFRGAQTIPLDALCTLVSELLGQWQQWLVAGVCLVGCLLYTSPSPRDRQKSRMPSSA